MILIIIEIRYKSTDTVHWVQIHNIMVKTLSSEYDKMRQYQGDTLNALITSLSSDWLQTTEVMTSHSVTSSHEFPFFFGSGSEFQDNFVIY